MKLTTEHLREIASDLEILLILYLFYRSIWVITLLLPCAVVNHRWLKKDRSNRRKELLGRQFKDMLDSLVASLRAGYSVENSLKECLAEMTIVHGEGSPICEELRIMQNQIRLGVPLEEIFLAFGKRSEQEDIETFASVFQIVRKTGGDLVGILQKTADDIAGKMETKNEIQVLISARKLEMKMIQRIPAVLILYISLTSGGLLDPLYGNVTGICIMTICLGIYAGAVFLGKRMMEISV